LTRDRRSLPLVEKIVSLLSPTDEDFRDFYKGTFYYVDAVCFVLELLNNKKSIPILEELHKYDCLNQMCVYDHLDVDFVNERQALLELGLGRALALSGSPQGIKILISYLEDNRRILNEFAHLTLIKTTGRNFDKDPIAWNKWLELNKNTFQSIPITERVES